MPIPDPTAAPRVLAGAVSPLTADLVHGPPRRAEVLAAGRVGVYLRLDGRVLPVLGPDAVALPSALRVAEPVHVAALAPGDGVVVGEGTVRLPSATVVARRTWRPARVPAGRLCSDLGRVVALLAAATADAPGWLVDGVAHAVHRAEPEVAVRALVGRGPGLTPSGDDALAGALLLHRAAGSPSDALAAAVRARLTATTAVSAALLEGAVDGWAAPDVVALVAAVARADAAGVTTHLPAVLAVGHTSGRDLVTGLAATLAALAPTGRIAA
ncbi:DUF2877 domain-containing protein [Phycicoccus sp. MAQZ13P-2]|uniref:oxamate carbamoyltransferase subunit AllH family protein n=1 Tax=Phycicoccus mangrovi TaxID=2840470 RepID=UPI001C006F60|nr:DUF2877 domain-containing protein [Phycicoccus mangrovi]MBT9257635.1 DUF2877 domain-containing protein [Phycicoccus mangrovi]MBT9276074.1 DUF2877 domain-containing protein [Phycicoccus mangrovi]